MIFLLIMKSDWHWHRESFFSLQLSPDGEGIVVNMSFSESSEELKAKLEVLMGAH